MTREPSLGAHEKRVLLILSLWQTSSYLNLWKGCQIRGVEVSLRELEGPPAVPPASFPPNTRTPSPAPRRVAASRTQSTSSARPDLVFPPGRCPPWITPHPSSPSSYDSSECQCLAMVTFKCLGGGDNRQQWTTSCLLEHQARRLPLPSSCGLASGPSPSWASLGAAWHGALTVSRHRTPHSGLEQTECGTLALAQGPRHCDMCSIVFSISLSFHGIQLVFWT